MRHEERISEAGRCTSAFETVFGPHEEKGEPTIVLRARMSHLILGPHWHFNYGYKNARHEQKHLGL
jgi:hypothetical protein